MTTLTFLLLLTGSASFCVGSYWMFSGRPMFLKEMERNLEVYGLALLFVGFAMILVSVGLFKF